MDKKPPRFENKDYRESVHSDDAGLHNRQPMLSQFPPDANAEENYMGEGEDLNDGDEKLKD